MNSQFCHQEIHQHNIVLLDIMILFICKQNIHACYKFRQYVVITFFLRRVSNTLCVKKDREFTNCKEVRSQIPATPSRSSWLPLSWKRCCPSKLHDPHWCLWAVAGNAANGTGSKSFSYHGNTVRNHSQKNYIEEIAVTTETETKRQSGQTEGWGRERKLTLVLFNNTLTILWVNP